MTSSDERVDQAYARLRKLGLRLTPQRMAIAKCVLVTDWHPTAEEVYQKIRPEYPTISLATVYSTLDTLVRAGMLQAVSTREVIRYDSHVPRHINLICLNCGKIIDVDDDVIAEVAKKRAAGYGFHIVDQQYSVYGYCEECRSEVS
ncbi:MAG TPA: Fur family transcriptional regulator [Conexivisphaerales archaeon]|nr:Fur family transcriptional regulator [Conexivisphaerales archaeon]